MTRSVSDIACAVHIKCQTMDIYNRVKYIKRHGIIPVPMVHKGCKGGQDHEDIIFTPSASATRRW